MDGWLDDDENNKNHDDPTLKTKKQNKTKQKEGRQERSQSYK